MSDIAQQRSLYRRQIDWVKWGLILTGVVLSILFLVVPIAWIFMTAFSKGIEIFTDNLLDSDMLHAVWLTLLIALITVPINMLFGISMAWLVTRFRFPGRQWLMTLIDIPFAVSPVVAGLLVPVMMSQGSQEDEAAVLLGASSWKMFWRVTLPNIRWALLYGVVLTNARAIGEFGAVSVVSGAIRGETYSLPLQVELLHQDYNTVGAFTAAALLAMMAIITLMVKSALQWHLERQQ